MGILFSYPFFGSCDVKTLEISFHSIDQHSKNLSLMSAIESENLIAVRSLIAHGADVNATVTRAGNSVKVCPTLLALRSPDILEVLISAGADINKQFSLRKTLLHFTDNYETLCLLIRYGADVNAADLYGRTPLHGCLHIKQNALALIECGANIQIPDHKGWTPFHKGCQTLDIDLLRKFVELGHGSKSGNIFREKVT